MPAERLLLHRDGQIAAHLRHCWLSSLPEQTFLHWEAGWHMRAVPGHLCQNVGAARVGLRCADCRGPLQVEASAWSGCPAVIMQPNISLGLMFYNTKLTPVLLLVMHTLPC